MKRLTLLRHAKSGWDAPVDRDFDRPLNQRGQRGAAAVGAHVRAMPSTAEIDFILASPAVRVTETLDIFLPAAGLDHIEPHWDRRIYLASSVTLMDCLHDLPDDVAHVLMCGHNPGMEDLILELVADDGRSPARDIVEDKFPTAAIAIIDLNIDRWADICERCGLLSALVMPRELDPALGPGGE